MDFYDAGNPGANGSEETTWNGDLQVGEWCFRPQIGEISMGEERIRPEPRVMDVLVYLAHHPGKVLPRERIIAAVWNSSFFSDEVLTNAISALRKAFRDDARNPSFIQTLPRRGYLWLAPTTIEVDSRGRYEARGSLQEWRERTRRLLSGAFLAVPMAALLATCLFRPGMFWETTPPADSVTVLSAAGVRIPNECQGLVSHVRCCSGLHLEAPRFYRH